MYWDGGHVESLPVHYNCAVNIHSIHVLASEGTLACVSQVRNEIRNMSSVHSSKYLLIVMHWVCTVCDKTRAPFGLLRIQHYEKEFYAFCKEKKYSCNVTKMLKLCKTWHEYVTSDSVDL